MKEPRVKHPSIWYCDVSGTTVDLSELVGVTVHSASHTNRYQQICLTMKTGTLAVTNLHSSELIKAFVMDINIAWVNYKKYCEEHGNGQSI